MSTQDQTHSARLHGEALLAAQDNALDDLIWRLAAATDRPGVRAEVAGTLARDAIAELGRDGADYADIARRLIAAGLTLESGVVDYDRLGQVVRAADDNGLVG